MRQRLKDLGTSLTNQDLMYNVIGNLPMKYRIEKKDFKIKLQTKELTLNDIEVELKNAYNEIVETQEKCNEESDEEKEMTLTTMGFKGRCNNCGAYGHNKYQCPELKSNDNNSYGRNDGNGRGQGNRGIQG